MIGIIDSYNLEAQMDSSGLEAGESMSNSNGMRQSLNDMIALGGHTMLNRYLLNSRTKKLRSLGLYYNMQSNELEQIVTNNRMIDSNQQPQQQQLYQKVIECIQIGKDYKVDKISNQRSIISRIWNGLIGVVSRLVGKTNNNNNNTMNHRNIFRDQIDGDINHPPTSSYNPQNRNPQLQLQSIPAIESISLTGSQSIMRGQFVMIRGPSGCGKTTFLNIIGTIDNMTRGSLSILSHKITESTPQPLTSYLRRHHLGIVFQTYNLLAMLSAVENVQLPMRIAGGINNKENNNSNSNVSNNYKLSNDQIQYRAMELLKRVGLGDRSEHQPSELSGGEQQRLAIARSLANSPDILLLDQPTGDLDSRNTIQVMNLLLQLNNTSYLPKQYYNSVNSGNSNCNNNNDNPSLLHTNNPKPLTIVMVTHNPYLQCYADRIIYFTDGKIQKQVRNQIQFAMDVDQYSAYVNAGENNQ